MELKVIYLLLVILQVFSLQAVPYRRASVSFFHAIHQSAFALYFSRGVVKNMFKNLRSVLLLRVLNRNYLDGCLIRQCEWRDSKTLPVIHNMPCTQKTLGIPRLFHATTKVQYHKTKDNDERDQSECVEIRGLFFTSHTCTQRSRCSSFI